jgi:Flp pilus assembly protein TadD
MLYSVEHAGGRVLHREARVDSSGRTIAAVEAEARYVVGSGRQAFSYVIERDGFLFESPITWYSRDRRWYLSPSYETQNRHFNRPILADCLFCHANRVEPVTSAINRYRAPIFRGHAIGCERCHGPGELHVASPRLVEGKDVTIVNPARLEPSLRDGVCEQCHLIARRRVSRAGVESDDYRPGLPYYLFWSAFVSAEASADNRFAGQVEQMHASECYQRSEGGLGCISCHDPHVWPKPEEKVAYFRERCLQCHTARGCSVPARARQERPGGDDCIGCHMPRASSSNNPHVATTNHRIPRRDLGTDVPPLAPGQPRAPLLDLVNFHRTLMNGTERAKAERDRGIALSREGRPGAAAALPLLEAAVAADPSDLPALEAKGEALRLLGRPDLGLGAYRLALAREPGRQTALEGAARVAFLAKRHQDAISFWQQAIAVNPWRSDYFAELARVQLQVGDFRGAADASREALRLSPALLEARKWLVESFLQLGNKDDARREFEILMAFEPPEKDALDAWFAARIRQP